MVLLVSCCLCTVKMKSYPSEIDSVQYSQNIQCGLPTRGPLKVLQVQSFHKNLSKMSVSNKNERTNSYLAYSKQPNQICQKKYGVGTSELLKSKSTINKNKAHDLGAKSTTYKKETSKNSIGKSNGISLKTKPVSINNEGKINVPESNIIGSLTSSPKWSRIKDKFENVEISSKAKICRSSSLPRSDNETLQIKRDFSRASSRSLTSLSFESNFSTAKNGAIAKHATCKKSTIVDKPECPTQRSMNKSKVISTNDVHKGSACEAIKVQSKKLPVSTKIDTNENKVTVSKIQRTSHTPLSARSAASALMLASSRTASVLGKTANGTRDGVSNLSKKPPEDKASNGYAHKFSSKPLVKSSVISTTAKIVKTPLKNVSNLKPEPENATKNLSIDKDEYEPVSVTSCHKIGSLNISLNNSLLMNSEINKNERHEFDITNISDGSRLRDQSTGRIPTTSSQINRNSKSLWVKDSVGSWKKADIPTVSSCKDLDNPSKVAQLRTKFITHADEKNTQQLDDAFFGKRNLLLKSSTTSCVPVKVSDVDYDADLSNRQMSKSITTSSICSTVYNPSQIISCNDKKPIVNVTSFANQNDQIIMKNSSSVHVGTIQSNDNSKQILKNSASSPKEISPDSARKLSLVQRAILSYEGNLSLLSPETQRKLKLLGERVEAETDDDKLLVAKAKNDILTRNTVRSTNNSQSGLQIVSLTTDLVGTKQNVSSHEEKAIQPVRNFLSRYQSMNKQIVENKSRDVPFEDELKRKQRLDKIFKKYEFKPISSVPSFHKDENFTSQNNQDSPGVLRKPESGLKTINSTVYSNDTEDISLYANCVNDNFLAKEKNLQSKVPNSGVKLDHSLKPNTSFLWRNTNDELNPEQSIKSIPSKIENESEESNYYDLENYYSLIGNPAEGHVVSRTENNRCSNNSDQSSVCSSIPELMSKPVKNCNPRSSGHEEKVLHDADDGWTDLSDEDIYSQEAGSKTNLLSNTLKKRKNKKYANRKSHLRRSWSQSLRDITNASSCDKSDWSKNECTYGTCIESSKYEQESDSDANDGEHFYEPVYESLANYMTTKEPIECYSADQSPDSETAKNLVRSSHTSLESAENVPANDTCSETASEVQTDCSETSAGISKKAGDKIRQLKRHLSWTKNDFKLELSSKFNKIKIQKDLNNDTEIGVRVHEDSTAFANPKKKTFIKCILKQKNASVPIKRIPSPKKEGSLFYVHLSMSREKQRPYSDSCVGQSVLPENAKEENTLQKSKKKSEPSLSFSPVSNTTQQPTRRLRKGSSGIIIQRPKTPPPLPPTNHVPKITGKADSPEIQENTSSLYKILNKGMSLDSAYRSISSNDSDSVSFDIPDIRSSYQTTEESDETVIEKDLDEDHEFRFENKDNLTSLSSIIDCFSTSIMFSQRTRGSLASSISGDSYVPADESGSSGGASSTVYSSGLTPPASEADIGEYNERCTSSLTNDLSLTLFSNFKNELLKSPFEEEPMYQFYHKDVQQRATLWCTTDGSESEFEDDQINKSIEQDDVPAIKPPVLQSQLSAMELIHGEGGQRTLWCEVPEVRNSGILENISAQDRKIQEAMFEVITSEASYLKSLNFLIEHFVQCPEFSGEFVEKHILDKRERHILFSDVPPVRDASVKLLADLEKRWLENIVLSNVCDVIHRHASKYFSVYVKYCSNQIYQDRKLKELKENRPEFVEVLKKLESSPVCQGLDMHSFLMLPMQRITRLPLLVDAIFHRLSVDSPIYESCKMALTVLNKIVAECNEGARKMQRMEEMLVISRHLDFRECKGLGLLSASRWLVKKGELVRLLLDTTNRRTFGRSVRWCKIQLYLFLFTDLLVVTRKKSDDTYCVVDYCPRNMVQVVPVDENVPPLGARLPSSYRNLFQMIMLNNQEGKTVEMLLSCLLESDRTRWVDAVTPAISENPDEKIYEEWDCPQVQCTHSYIALQPDELSLEEADVVNVFRKMSDGWYEGERIRDGIRGWFPSSHTVEIISSHVRARNLRQRYRLLMLSQTYLEEQQRAQAAAQGKGK